MRGHAIGLMSRGFDLNVTPCDLLKISAELRTAVRRLQWRGSLSNWTTEELMVEIESRSRGVGLPRDHR